jgi:hypothetical protein
MQADFETFAILGLVMSGVLTFQGDVLYFRKLKAFLAQRTGY